MPDTNHIVDDVLPALNRSLEFGLIDSAMLQTVLDALTEAPQTLLPEALGQLMSTAFLIWKCERTGIALRILFSCLSWCLLNGKDDAEVATITKNISYMFAKDGHTVADEDIRLFAREGHAIGTDSWRLDIADIDTGKGVVEFADGVATANRTRFAGGFTPLTRSAVPLTTFHGWLKRLDPAVLNPTGRCIMRWVFPQFSSGTPAEHLSYSEHLRGCGVELGDAATLELTLLRKLLQQGAEPTLRRHRRFAGGDGLLPRGCYSTVCHDALGSDGGVLSRELLAYADPRIPGVVFVGDSTSLWLNALLGNQVAAMPGYSITWVLLFAPPDAAAREVFSNAYAEVLERSENPSAMVSAFALETRVDECSIDGVVDLRLPHVQRWFYEHFKTGDGHFLRKPAGGILEFYDMVPTLMHSAIGGNPATHAIGSWMRSSGVYALIYPSARSDALVTMLDDAMVDSHGWILVDYREARELPATELTDDAMPWSDFVQPGVALSVANRGPERGSWVVGGIQAAYDTLRRQVLEGAATDEATSSPVAGRRESRGAYWPRKARYISRRLMR